MLKTRLNRAFFGIPFKALTALELSVGETINNATIAPKAETLIAFGLSFSILLILYFGVISVAQLLAQFPGINNWN